MDYGKFKYKQKKRQPHSKAHHSTQIKEIRLKPKTEHHDIEHKVRHAREFLSEGSKVLVSMRFWGRELSHTEMGYQVMGEFAKELENDAKIELAPKMDGRRMSMTLAPLVK